VVQDRQRRRAVEDDVVVAADVGEKLLKRWKRSAAGERASSISTAARPWSEAMTSRFSRAFNNGMRRPHPSKEYVLHEPWTGETERHGDVTPVDRGRRAGCDCPRRARPAAIDTAVVVLAVPPFWLSTAITLAGGGHDRGGVTNAGVRQLSEQ